MATLVSAIVVFVILLHILCDFIRWLFGADKYRFELLLPLWHLLLPQTWRNILEDHMRCAVSPYRVIGLTEFPETLPRFTFTQEDRHRVIYCWHEDEAVLLNLRYGGEVKRVSFWKEMFGNN